MDKLRVIQWTTGKVGTLALRAILDDPRLDLVGVYAWSDTKAGRDAGELCGREATGVVASSDIAALVDLKPDAVIYTPFMADIEHLETLLAAGINVVSTNLLLNLGGAVGDTKDRLDAACAKGGASLHITGVSPGWVNAVTVALTAVCRDVQSITMTESANVSNYESEETWRAMGIGGTEAGETTLAMVQGAMVSFRDAAARIAEAVGIALDEVEFDITFARAANDTDLGFMTIPKDTFAALKGGWTGRSGGVDRVRTEVIWYLTEDLVEDWTFGDDHYDIQIKGEPDVDARIKFVAPQWTRHEWENLTALPAVSCVPQVVAARLGVLGLLDAGLPAAPAGHWLAAKG